jgi:hypothetical protein
MSRAAPAPGLDCPHCGAPLHAEGLAAGTQTCIACDRTFEAIPFAPPERRAEVRRLAEAGPGGATACARHAGNAAVAHCGRCGVFMCALCRIETDGLELCPECFDRLSAAGELASTRTRFVDYRGLAIVLATLGYLLSCFGVVLGPAAVVCGVLALKQRRAWNERGGRAGIWTAMVFGAFQFLAALLFLGLIVYAIQQGMPK